MVFHGYSQASMYAIKATDSYPSIGNKAQDDPSLIQQIMTWLITISIGDTFRGIFTLFFGSVSIDKLLFNNYPNTKLAFYGNGENPLLEGGLKDMINV